MHRRWKQAARSGAWGWSSSWAGPQASLPCRRPWLPVSLLVHGSYHHYPDLMPLKHAQQSRLSADNFPALHAHTREQASNCKLCQVWAGCMLPVMSGAIAGVVDICLIPEVHFTEDKLMAYIDKQLQKKGHAVICVAEGAGQDMLMKSGTHQGFDASGNPILQDVGTYLRHIIRKKLEVQTLAHTLRSS